MFLPPENLLDQSSLEKLQLLPQSFRQYPVLTTSSPTTGLEPLDFLPCGVMNLRVSLAANILSLLCIRNLSDLAAHHQTLLLTALRTSSTLS